MKGELIQLKILALAKQVPKVEEFVLDAHGYVQRDGVAKEMSAYCRRAVAKGVELAKITNGHCTVATLGPPSAEDILREALAFGADDAVLLSDLAFRGSDTLATARAIVALMELVGPFDLVLVGRSSIDAETGQVGPQLAELLNYPFASAVRKLEVEESGTRVRVTCEQDDGWRASSIQLPAVLAVAERLCQPAKVPSSIWSAVSKSRVRTISTVQLPADGPWGIEGSHTKVDGFEAMHVSRSRSRFSGPIDKQVDIVLEAIADATDVAPERGLTLNQVKALDGRSQNGFLISVLVEPERPEMSRALLAKAASMASSIGGWVVALSSILVDPSLLWSWGADEIALVYGAGVEEEFACAVSQWAAARRPRVMLAIASYWGREVASRVAARTGSGLTGDAIGVEIDAAGQLIAWKSACADNQRVTITSDSALQMATIRPGVLPIFSPRVGEMSAVLSVLRAIPKGRIQIESQWRDDQCEALAVADLVIGIGMGVNFDEYAILQDFSKRIGAELAATRKVTDRGWLPRSRQVGITGRTISPRLYLAIGLSGKLNHMVGVAEARKIIAINKDGNAPVFDHCDIGIIADWREVVEATIQRLGQTVDLGSKRNYEPIS